MSDKYYIDMFGSPDEYPEPEAGPDPTEASLYVNLRDIYLSYTNHGALEKEDIVKVLKWLLVDIESEIEEQVPLPP